jgi:serine/threonine-protein kinase PknG
MTAMAAVPCAQPRCGGTIEDGYCTVCGLAPTLAGSGGPGGPGASGPAGASVPAAVSGLASPAAPAFPAGRSASFPSGRSASLSGSVGSTGTIGTRGSAGSRGSRSGSGRLSRGRLGAGLVEVPPVPALDPASAVLADPRVPEHKRFCGNCGELVGQSRDGRPGMTEGFCPHCRTRFSFAPKLATGELVAGQYEVLGALAHGGLGWIYLARDHNVSDRWVVLKGLLNTGDADALAAAEAESRFLAQVEHPNIVKIFNFVKHTSRGDGETAGYIVMEYMGGKSLKQIRLEARQRHTAVPLAHALAYALEVLPALGYLHDRGLVYCDFKPDNVIQSEEQIKLIDLGGVRAIDGDGAIYGTVGYQAPEIENDGPSPSSDLYTVGRTLAVLTFDFAYQGEYKYRLPADVPLLQAHESFARFLRRATNPDPSRRFQSAGEMAEQLTGVLREVLSVADGEPRPSFSGLFSPELRAVGIDLTPSGSAAAAPGPAEVIGGLPVPLAESADPAAGYLATLAGLPPEQQAAALLAAVAGEGGIPQPVTESAETRLALVRALVVAGDADQAQAHLAELAAVDPADWRIAWYTGLCELARGRPDQAGAAFSAVYDELPGELAPKLALGFAAEAAGRPAVARRYFQTVWAIDRSCVSAAFGAARACLAGGDRVAAIAAVAAVPPTSSYHAAAQIAAIRLLVAVGGQAPAAGQAAGTGIGAAAGGASPVGGSVAVGGYVSAGSGVSAGDLRQADSRLSVLALDDLRREQLTVEILRAALDWVSTAPSSARPRGESPAGERILGCEPNERALRFGLERGYRALAGLSPDPARRHQLIDLANSVRPRTWL